MSIRDEAQAILDLAESRLRDDRVTDVNVRHDLEEIARAARTMLQRMRDDNDPHGSGRGWYRDIA